MIKIIPSLFLSFALGVLSIPICASDKLNTYVSLVHFKL